MVRPGLAELAGWGRAGWLVLGKVPDTVRLQVCLRRGPVGELVAVARVCPVVPGSMRGWAEDGVAGLHHRLGLAVGRLVHLPGLSVGREVVRSVWAERSGFDGNRVRDGDFRLGGGVVE